MASTPAEPHGSRSRASRQASAPLRGAASKRNRSHAAASRDRILEAAATLFRELGYAATGIAAVCKQSGCPASSLYWHFENKAGLLGAVLEREQARMLEEMEEAYGTDVRVERAIELGFAAIDTPRTDFIRLLVQVGLERAPRDPTVAQLITSLRARTFEFHERMLARRFEIDALPKPKLLARRCARIAFAYAQGSILSQRMSPETFKPQEAARDLIAALAGLRAQHVQRHAAAPPDSDSPTSRKR